MRSISIAVGLLLAAASLATAQEGVAPPVGTPNSGALFGEPRFIGAGINWASAQFGVGDVSAGPKSGFRMTSGKTVAGSGWLSAGAAYRQNLFAGRAFVEGSVGASIRAYRSAQATFEWTRLLGRPIAVGSQAVWNDFTQVSYFGTGAGSLDSMRTQYRIHYADLIAYSTVHLSDALSVETTAGVLGNVKLSTPAGPLQRELPFTVELFPDEPVFALADLPRFTHAGASVTFDTRDYGGYPRHGGVYRAAWNGYWSSSNAQFNFSRAEAEGLQLVPLVEERWTLALRGWTAITGTRDDHVVPFFMMPTLGGNNSLRAEHAYRFADRHMLLTTVESRLHLTEHLDGTVFLDAGSVAAKVRELDLSKQAVGVGLRLHTRTTTLARIELSRGDAGWRLAFNLNDPFRLSRLKRRTSALPFNP